MNVLQVFLKLQRKTRLEERFRLVCGGFFARYPPEKDSMPLKRFLTLHGEEFSKKHPAIFKTICEELVGRLRLSAWQSSLAEATD